MSQIDAPKILIVDDDVSSLKATQYQLSGKGIRARTATSVDMAEALIGEEMPDIIICDWTMPDRDGIDFVKSLRQNPLTRGIYFIMLTGRSGTDDKITALIEGVDDYLEKPVKVAELEARIIVAKRIIKLQRQLVQSQKMQTYAEMAAAVSHEINNPLTGLLGYIELAKKRVQQTSLPESDKSRIQQMLDRSYEQGKRIGEIVKKLVSIKDYRVKTYSAGIQMVDIHSSDSATKEP
ncbi:MAG: response regulator [Chloroherpetonaceae bacterium]|nr:response regulator [Chloroherpetonaceae bacterium]MDW8436867.1 response regulator [Chloroherpetonaceae bacterium]